ncbi:MAG: small ribosomal subunit Rsm22 family protein [Verrucomicrobiota bacterium]
MDRSALAVNFATQRARTKYPQLTVETTALPEQVSGGTLLISHVLTELTQEQTETLAALAATAECVVWVEPGTYEASLTLIAVRERLRNQFQLVAPCTHQERCGILAPQNERHWCHHFANPPAEIFTDSNWARFANLFGIDLRDLPLSFLVLDKRPMPASPENAARLIGHPRLYKGYAMLLGCNATGVSEQRLAQRAFPSEYKGFKKGRHPSLCQWQCAKGEIQAYQPLD